MPPQSLTAVVLESASAAVHLQTSYARSAKLGSTTGFSHVLCLPLGVPLTESRDLCESASCLFSNPSVFSRGVAFLI